MHDVIGLDGVTPAYFRYVNNATTNVYVAEANMRRWLAREKLAHYATVSMTNGTVTSIQSLNTTNPSFSTQVVYPSGETATLTARSIVLAIGLRDILPDTPGLKESWGQGIYWVSCTLPRSQPSHSILTRLSARGATATSMRTSRWVC